MKRICLVVVAVGALGMFAARPLSAQIVRWGPMAGVLMPLGNYGESDKMGFVVGLGVTRWMPVGMVGLRVDGMYGQTPHDGSDGHTNIIGGMMSVVYALAPASAPARPMITGGIGFYNVDFNNPVFGSASDTKIGFGLGAAVAFKLGPSQTRVVLGTRFTSISTTGSSITFLPITIGLSLGR
jgi:hypothetical protein